mgnify:CR=1 FL=1
MWVSRKEFKQLSDRVVELESRHKSIERDLSGTTHLTVYKDTPYGLYTWPCSIPSERISVHTLIYRILDKIGMELKYQDGAPAAVQMLDKPKPKRSHR